MTTAHIPAVGPQRPLMLTGTFVNEGVDDAVCEGDGDRVGETEGVAEGEFDLVGV